MDPLDHLGIGVFETFRVNRTAGGRFAVVALDRHFARLRAGAKTCGIVLPDDESLLAQLRDRLVQAGVPDAKTRIIARRSGVSFTVDAFEPLPERPVRVCAIAAERGLPEIKSCSSLVSVVAREEAVRRGAFEAILIDRTGAATEGAWSNLFWLSDGGWKTPKSFLLPGIARSIALEALTDCELLDAPWQEIASSAQACFLTQATNGVIAVEQLDQRVVQTSPSDEIAALFKLRAAQLLVQF